MKDSLRVVILECPYNTFASQEASLLFGKSIELRIRGYQDAFGEKVFPLDASDFMGRHTLIYDTSGEEPKVLVTYKTLSLKRCQEFKIPFPVSSLASAVNNSQYLAYSKRMISEAARSGSDVVYHGSWTADPEVRASNRDLADQLREIMFAVSVHLSLKLPPQRDIVAGNIRFKTDRFFKSVGYKIAEEQGQPLPGFDVLYASAAEPAVLMELEQFSPYALSLVQKYQSICENIKFISAENAGLSFSKAA